MMGAGEGLLVLAIESSCDETAVALMRGRQLLANAISSQVEIHGEYGGVVPEVASRNHMRVLEPLLRKVLGEAGVSIESVDLIAATNGPGLATSLMVGLSLAKGMAIALKRSFCAVNHIEGHLLSPFLSEGAEVCPAVGLVVSGGHTLLVGIESVGRYTLLGRTLDDAAGEAFDKVGKLLGLPYPGGPNVDIAAREGDATRFDFPRSMIGSGDLNFSFSGLKTAVRYMLPKHQPVPVADICASFQEAVADILVRKALAAVKKTGVKVLAVSGGVSCNSRVRKLLQERCAKQGVRLLLASGQLCTDNAAMIGFVAGLRFRNGMKSELAAEVEPSLKFLSLSR